jgi:hypothetical protein
MRTPTNMTALVFVICHPANEPVETLPPRAFGSTRSRSRSWSSIVIAECEHQNRSG